MITEWFCGNVDFLKKCFKKLNNLAWFFLKVIFKMMKEKCFLRDSHFLHDFLAGLQHRLLVLLNKNIIFLFKNNRIHPYPPIHPTKTTLHIGFGLDVTVGPLFLTRHNFPEAPRQKKDNFSWPRHPKTNKLRFSKKKKISSKRVGNISAI